MGVVYGVSLTIYAEGHIRDISMALELDPTHVWRRCARSSSVNVECRLGRLATRTWPKIYVRDLAKQSAF